MITFANAPRRLDGLNKKLNPWTWGFEHHDYNVNCNSRGIAKLQYPSREYIIQVARFDPAKGIPDLIKSYGKLRRHYLEHMPVEKTPQLVMLVASKLVIMRAHTPDIVLDAVMARPTTPMARSSMIRR